MHLFYSSELESEQVGIADYRISRNPHRALVTGWLGAGLGLAAFDPIASVAGLIHVPLADSRSARDKSRRRPALFLDTGLPALFQGRRRPVMDSKCADGISCRIRCRSRA
jgi:chemotaxis receptor (MCP) glutamine deamidase CheD